MRTDALVVTSDRRRGSTPAGGDQVRQSTRPQKDETGRAPTGATARVPSYTGMKLPHERDESAEADTGSQRSAEGTRPRIAQGQRDLADGQQDTDNYNRVAEQHDATEHEPEDRKPKPP